MLLTHGQVTSDLKRFPLARMGGGRLPETHVPRQKLDGLALLGLIQGLILRDAEPLSVPVG